MVFPQGLLHEILDDVPLLALQRRDVAQHFASLGKEATGAAEATPHDCKYVAAIVSYLFDSFKEEKRRAVASVPLVVRATKPCTSFSL